MKGLKNVRNRRTDALAQVGWDRLEVMLAAYYSAQDYQVDHCGTGNSRARFDGGIDLKLRKDDAHVLVQCKHWNAKQVPHNAVHELMGVMVNEGATGAILVTSGEFTRAAIEAATKQGHVQLVDGDDLREMLGPIPDMHAPAPPEAWAGAGSLAQRTVASVGERLLSAAEDRIRYGGTPASRNGRGVVRSAAQTALIALLLKLVGGMLMFLLLWFVLQHAIGSIVGAGRGPAPPSAGRQTYLPAPDPAARSGALRQVGIEPANRAELIDHYTGTTIQDRPAGMPPYRPPSDAEVRETQRRADEAMRIIEANTPEM